MVLAFRAYLRVGEMAPRSNDDTKGCLKLGDVSMSAGIITIQVKNFKHSTGAQRLNIRSGCIEHIKEFTKARGVTPSVLFAFPDGKPFKRREFDTILKELFTLCGFNTAQFKDLLTCFHFSLILIHSQL